MCLQNVLRLSSLVSTAKQNDYCAASPNELNPKSGAVINRQFRNAVANRPHVSRVSQQQSSDSDIDPGFCHPVSQTVEPLPVCLVPADFYHWDIVSHRIQSFYALRSNVHSDSCAAEWSIHITQSSVAWRFRRDDCRERSEREAISVTIAKTTVADCYLSCDPIRLILSMSV